MDYKIGRISFFLVITLLANAEADCRKPRISLNVIINTNQTWSSQFSNGSVIEFTCKDGFHRTSGDSVITCIDKRWKVIIGHKLKRPVQFHCKEKTCIVENPVNGFIIRVKKVVLYLCNRGYRLQGTEKCRLNKRQHYYSTLKFPRCIKRPECHLPEIPHLSINGSTYDGETAEFFCPVQYELIGEKTVRCGSDGNWEKTLPHCQKCDSDGDLEDTLSCKTNPTCEDPGESQFSNRSGNCCNVGMSLTYTCHKGYEFLNEEAGGTITCIARDTWSGPKPICKHITPIDTEIPSFNMRSGSSAINMKNTVTALSAILHSVVTLYYH